MDHKILNDVIEKTHELIHASTCSNEAKTAAQRWLESLGTEREAAETKRYMDELEADIMPIDQLIGFAESDYGIEYFGADTAKNIAAHAQTSFGAFAEKSTLYGSIIIVLMPLFLLPLI